LDPDKKDMQLVALGDSLVRLEALKRGIVDATIMLIPHVILARDSGFKVLGHAGTVMELSTPGLGTSEKFLKEKPELVKRIVRASVKGILFLRRTREESIRIMMGWLSLDKDIAEKSYDMVLESFSEDGSPSRRVC
jgi:ABC-type nitrate/sulfonate/bicarbonate transport system substrate-binding protein